MIKIDKSSTIPSTLTTRGNVRTVADKAKYISNPSLFTNTARKTPKINFLATIYGCEEVKDQLKEDQHRKCCYCENTFLDVSYGDVEHFRPKKGYTNVQLGPLIKPGYYWLAYDWSNLHLACEICNRKHKKNYFPLKPRSYRVTDHHNEHRIPDEEPLLLCPTDDNSAHFSFNEHVIKGTTDEGITSVYHYGLDRTELNQTRRDHYMLLQSLEPYYNYNPNMGKIKLALFNLLAKKKFTIEKLQKLIHHSRNILDNAATKKSKFTLMVRENFPDLPTT